MRGSGADGGVGITGDEEEGSAGIKRDVEEDRSEAGILGDEAGRSGGGILGNEEESSGRLSREEGSTL